MEEGSKAKTKNIKPLVAKRGLTVKTAKPLFIHSSFIEPCKVFSSFSTKTVEKSKTLDKGETFLVRGTECRKNSPFQIWVSDFTRKLVESNYFGLFIIVEPLLRSNYSSHV